MKEFAIPEKNVYIKAGSVELGTKVQFGRNIDIKVQEKFHLGDRSRLGNDVRIRARFVFLGNDLYHSRGLDVGGGGCDRQNSALWIGDRCTIHDNHINLAERVVIGDDVGLSPAVTIYTHGFWWSVLEGFPATFASVTIGHRTIIGYRSTILPGVDIGMDVVVGAESVVTKSLLGNAVYAGNPARHLRDIERPEEITKKAMLLDILAEWNVIARYHGLDAVAVIEEYPRVRVNECVFNVETMASVGKQDEATDDFRDHMRRYGIRFYTDRPFRSALKW